MTLRDVLVGTPKFAEVGPLLPLGCASLSLSLFGRVVNLTEAFGFLQFLLPLVIEKLDSDVQSAKLDSLQTLVRSLLSAVAYKM